MDKVVPFTNSDKLMLFSICKMVDMFIFLVKSHWGTFCQAPDNSMIVPAKLWDEINCGTKCDISDNYIFEEKINNIEKILC